jgi:diaminopropionate ammonia-lyase
MKKLVNKRPAKAGSRLFRVNADRPIALLSACPIHQATPLVDAKALAEQLGVQRLDLKMESERMRLGSFKALGGAFALAQMVCDKATVELGRDVVGADIAADDVKAIAAGETFITASAGNHGLSVAAGANIFGAKAVIVLAVSVPEAFAERIRATGADVVRVDGSYEDSVAHAIKAADDNDWQLLADGSWPGYIDPPAMVMEGYTVLAEECRSAFEASGEWPTHVVLQAGVGGLAGSAAAHIREHWAVQPHITIVEPDAAPCLIASMEAGELTHASGPLSHMGRLDCKDASLIAFDALRQDADVFVTITEDEGAKAVEILGQHGVETTSSGGGGLAALFVDGLVSFDQNSRVLAIISEGPE